jgi:hypothetical protein
MLATIRPRSLSSRPRSKKVKIKIYRTVILPVVLYGSATWFLILKEEHRLRVLEKRVLRIITGLKWDGIIGGCRKLRNDELRYLYTSPNNI